jgi:hypothetical protein
MRMSLIAPPGLKNEANTLKKVSAAEGMNQAAPKIFAIETTMVCNLRCPECAIGGGGPRCLDSLTGGISSDSFGFFLVKHQAASANG